MRQVRLIRGLQAVEAQEQGTATMEVQLSHADVEGSWTRDGLRLQQGPTCHLAVRGPTHTLTLSGLRPEDSGLMVFKAEGVHTSALLVVTGALGGPAGLSTDHAYLSRGNPWEVGGDSRDLDEPAPYNSVQLGHCPTLVLSPL